MVTSGFFLVIAGVLLAAGLATYFFFGRKGEPDGVFEEPAQVLPLTDRKVWTQLVGAGTRTLQQFAQSGISGVRFRQKSGTEAQASAGAHGTIREFDAVDPHSFEGLKAMDLLTELGAPDRVAPGEAWYVAGEQTHYVLDGAGRLQKLPATGAVPAKLELGQPYLRWSWDRLVPAGVQGAEPRSWTFCITLPEDDQEPAVAEALIHPCPAEK